MLNCELVVYIQFIIDIAFIGKLKFYVLAIICTQQHPFERYQSYSIVKHGKLREKKTTTFTIQKRIFLLLSKHWQTPKTPHPYLSMRFKLATKAAIDYDQLLHSFAN